MTDESYAASFEKYVAYKRALGLVSSYRDTLQNVESTLPQIEGDNALLEPHRKELLIMADCMACNCRHAIARGID